MGDGWDQFGGGFGHQVCDEIAVYSLEMGLVWGGEEAVGKGLGRRAVGTEQEGQIR